MNAQVKVFKSSPVIIHVPIVRDFRAERHFVIDTSEEAEVKISGLGQNFMEYFLLNIEKGEVAAEDLVLNELLYPYNLAELDFDKRVEKKELEIITLGQYFAVFAQQPDGKNGPLVTNGRANIGNVPDFRGIPWEIWGNWVWGGWYFEASRRECIDEKLLPGRYILSH